MKTAIVLSLIATLGIGIGSSLLTQQPPVVIVQQDATASPLEKARRATFLITLFDYNIGGSATLVGRKKLDNGKYRYTALTGYHIVSKMAEAFRKDKAKASHAAVMMFQPTFHGKALRVKLDIDNIEWTVPSQDWATITFDMEHKMSCVQVATKEEFEAIKPFDRIYAIGCAGGYGQFCRTGIIGATHNEHRDIRHQTTKGQWLWDIHPERFFRPYINIWYGDSGGGIYNEEGKLIGIINGFGITNRATHSTIAFKTHIMLDVLQHSKDFFLVED